MDYEKQYAERLSGLREMAPDEHLVFDEDSASQFISFLQNSPFAIRKAAIGLGVNGEINAV